MTLESQIRNKSQTERLDEISPGREKVGEAPGMKVIRLFAEKF